MGYTSTLLDAPAFKSKFGITGFLKAWSKFKADKDGVNLADGLDLYSFIPTYEGRDDIIEIWMDEWEAKHTEDERLAEFISTVIHPESWTYLTFDDEDGARWGYWITSGEVQFLEPAWVLENDNVTLDDKIEAWGTAHEKKAIKKSRGGSRNDKRL
jgi:hypothetical protein